jgi:hypothetical protein
MMLPLDSGVRSEMTGRKIILKVSDLERWKRGIAFARSDCSPIIREQLDKIWADIEETRKKAETIPGDA